MPRKVSDHRLPQVRKSLAAKPTFNSDPDSRNRCVGHEPSQRRRGIILYRPQLGLSRHTSRRDPGCAGDRQPAVWGWSRQPEPRAGLVRRSFCCRSRAALKSGPELVLELRCRNSVGMANSQQHGAEPVLQRDMGAMRADPRSRRRSEVCCPCIRARSAAASASPPKMTPRAPGANEAAWEPGPERMFSADCAFSASVRGRPSLSNLQPGNGARRAVQTAARHDDVVSRPLSKILAARSRNSNDWNSLHSKPVAAAQEFDDMAGSRQAFEPAEPLTVERIAGALAEERPAGHRTRARRPPGLEPSWNPSRRPRESASSSGTGSP